MDQPTRRLVLEVERPVGQALAIEHRQQVHSLLGLDRSPRKTQRVFRLRGGPQRRHYIDDVAPLAYPVTGLADALRPVRDERRRSAAFVREVLVQPEGRVA